MIMYTEIKALHTFAGIVEKDGRHPTDADLSTVHGAAILVDRQGRVVLAGPMNQVKAKAAEFKSVKRVSLKGTEVLPAFTECHTHLLYDGSRSDEFELRNQGVSYLEIGFRGGGIRSTMTATAQANDRKLQTMLAQRTEEFLEQGVTVVEIKSGYAATLQEELRHLQILRRFQKRSKTVKIVVTALSAHTIPHGLTENEWLDGVIGTIFPYAKKEGVRVDIFIESGAFSLAGGRRYLRTARELGLRFSVHADQLSLSGGTGLGVEFGAQSVDHVIEVGEKEIKQLAQAGTTAVLLPAADVYTRLPFPKARQMIDAGVRVALATDHNPGSSPGLDLALVGCLARASMQMTLAEVLAGYTYNAACAIGLGAERGALVAGRRADFIQLAPDSGLHDLFYSVGPKRSMAAVGAVYVSGKRVYRRP